MLLMLARFLLWSVLLATWLLCFNLLCYLTGYLPRKEVIQPQLPLRLPCYDFVPVTNPTLDSYLCIAAVGPPASGVTSFHDVTGGVYKAREHIHRSVLTHGY